jgi:hypothetical protein
MKKYQVQVKMSYYTWVDVEAENEDSARDQALRKAWRQQSLGYGVWGEEPEVLELKEGGSE